MTRDLQQKSSKFKLSFKKNCVKLTLLGISEFQIWSSILHVWVVEPIRGRVDRAFATEKVSTVSFRGRIKPHFIKTSIHRFPACRSALKESVKPPPRVVDRWQLDSDIKMHRHYLQSQGE